MDGQPAPTKPDELWTLSGDDRGSLHKLAFGTGSHLIGSASDAKLKLIHPTISRRHARITCDVDGVTVEDLGSANGTFVQGRRIDTAVALRPGETLRLGEVELQLSGVANGCSEKPATNRPHKQCFADLLGPTTIGFLRNEGRELSFAAGELIVRRGDRQDSFYVVLEGEVELLLQEGGRHRRSLARIGVGATFGAESVLGEEGAAIDAAALTDVRIIRYPATALAAALRESESLRSKLLGGMARHLHEATEDALALLRGTEVITRLVQGHETPTEMVAVSARMRAVKNRLEGVAADRRPVLILGERGTGKTLAARLIHERSARSSGPIIAVSCRHLVPEQAAELILGSDGGEAGDGSSHAIGGIHFANGGTLVLRDIDSLPLPAQRLVADFLHQGSGLTADRCPDARVIATARSGRRDQTFGNGLSHILLSCFGEVIQMPRLAERPRDILPLAEAMLARSEAAPLRLTETAKHALLAMTYDRNNVAELEEVVERAAQVADSESIRSEHIFGGAGDDLAVPGLDITGSPLLKLATRPSYLRALRTASAAGYGIVIALCLAFGASTVGRVANSAVWSAWEPVVFAAFLLVGPIWCTVCPLSMASRGIKRLSSLHRPPPAWLVKSGPWLAILGFVLIVWSQRVFQMTKAPAASAVLLAALVGAAALCGFVFRREVWCRHLCPLGRLAVALAPAAPVQLIARRGICSSSCQTHECFKGTPSIPGCTVFHHPLETSQAHHCKLCMDCLNSCPHGSVQVQARAPLRAIWRLGGNTSEVALFGYTISLLALVLLLPDRLPGFNHPGWFTLACAVAVVLGLGVRAAVAALVGSGHRKGVTTNRIGFALMVLGWGALLLLQLTHIPFLSGSRIHIASSVLAPAWLARGISGLTMLQAAVLAAAAGAALFTLRHVRMADDEHRNAPLRWAVVRGLFIAYIIAASWLII